MLVSPTQPRGRGLRRAVPSPESAAWRCRRTCGVLSELATVPVRLTRLLPVIGHDLRLHSPLCIHTHITRRVCPPSPVALGTWLPNDRLPWLIPSSGWSEAWEVVLQKVLLNLCDQINLKMIRLVGEKINNRKLSNFPSNWFYYTLWLYH
jgi:hypothetical protein